MLFILQRTKYTPKRNITLRTCLRCARSFQVAMPYRVVATENDAPYRAVLSHWRYSGVIRKLHFLRRRLAYLRLAVGRVMARATRI